MILHFGLICDILRKMNRISMHLTSLDRHEQFACPKGNKNYEGGNNLEKTYRSNFDLGAHFVIERHSTCRN